MKLINLHYKMGAYPLFQSLNATFTAGLIAIVGNNGCGKSTLLKILSGLSQPQSGEVLQDDQDVYQSSSHKKRSLAYVPATSCLYPHLTVLENFKLVGRLKKLSTVDLQFHLLTILRQCDIVGYEHVLFGQLSDGLKKRVMIGSSLISQPQVLILDEPCSNLDPTQRNQLWDLLQNLKNNGRLIIFSSHHPQEITPFCDEIYLLDQGKLSTISRCNAFTPIISPRAPLPFDDTNDMSLSA